MKYADIVKKYAKRIANPKDMTTAEYRQIEHEIRCCDFPTQKQWVKLMGMLQTLEDNFIAMYRKFRVGDIVKYHNRFCKVGDLNLVRTEIMYGLYYVKDGYPVKGWAAESQMTIVK